MRDWCSWKKSAWRRLDVWPSFPRTLSGLGAVCSFSDVSWRHSATCLLPCFLWHLQTASVYLKNKQNNPSDSSVQWWDISIREEADFKEVLYLYAACRWADERDSPSDQIWSSFVFQGSLKCLCFPWKQTVLWNSETQFQKAENHLSLILHVFTVVTQVQIWLQQLKGTWTFCGRESVVDFVEFSFRGLFLWRARGHAAGLARRRLHHGPLVFIVLCGLWKATYKYIWLLKCGTNMNHGVVKTEDRLTEQSSCEWKAPLVWTERLPL